MDHETNNEKPSSTEGGEMSYKIGDKVWAKATVKHIDGKSLRLTFDDDWTLWFFASDCRPVEPANCPEIPDSSIESMRAAFEAGLIQRHGWNQGYFGRNENQYFDSQVELIWQAFQSGAKYQSSPLAPSPCMDGVNVDQFINGIMEARGRTSDPINPSHYKQGGIECIEAIKAALGEGFPGYLRGNVMKYLWRYKEKGGVEDLRKSAWYLGRLVKEVGE
jgi:hypothetical protein